MKRRGLRLLVLTATLGGLTTTCSRLGPGPGPVITRPVETRMVETIEAEAPVGATVIIEGRVIDARTREEIHLAQVVVESERGVMRFDSSFTFSFPTMSVITVTVSAPGYQPRQEVLKAHFRRDVTLTMEIPLEAASGGDVW